MAKWDTDELEIILVMFAKFQDTYYLLSYDYKPLAGKAKEALEQREEGAL